jgi:Sporulation and spore germination/Immunoglobulin-like domain of bacterial spore germination
MTEHEDPFETRLRRALQKEADMVEPAGDGLGRIRERTDGAGAAPWWRRFAPVLAAAVAAGIVVGGAFAVLGGDGNDGRDDAQVAAPTPTTGPSGTGPAEPTTGATDAPTAGGTDSPGPGEPSPDSPASPDPAAALPVYYLSDVGGELRLYREFRSAPGGAGPRGRAAVEEMLRGDPDDPDYTSVWPRDTRVLDYAVDGDTATVDLSEEALEADAGAEAEARSVAQLVYTVTAADPEVERVRLLVEGTEVEDLWGHGAVGEQPLTRAPMLDVQGLVWIIDPAQGAVTESPVTVRVFGTAFEGNVVLKAFRGAEEVEGTFVTTAQGEFAEGTTQINLPAGDYTLRAYDEFGEDASLVERDSKDFTVR